MRKEFRLTPDDLFSALATWDEHLSDEKIFLVACGGTALTLYGYKASTIDVDLLVPDLDDFERIIKLIKNLATGK